MSGRCETQAASRILCAANTTNKLISTFVLQDDADRGDRKMGVRPALALTAIVSSALSICSILKSGACSSARRT